MFRDKIFEDEKRLFPAMPGFCNVALDLCQEGVEVQSTEAPPHLQPFGHWVSVLQFGLKLLITNRYARKIFM